MIVPEEIQKSMTPDMRSKLLGEQSVNSKTKPSITPEVPQPRPSPSSVLSSKFVSSGTTLSSTVTTPGLQSAVAFAKGMSAQMMNKKEEVKKPVKVFTRATRQIVDWHPEKLLCKRFNVDMPFPSGPSEKSSRESQQTIPDGLLASFAPTQASHSKPI